MQQIAVCFCERIHCNANEIDHQPYFISSLIQFETEQKIEQIQRSKIDLLIFQEQYLSCVNITHKPPTSKSNQTEFFE